MRKSLRQTNFAVAERIGLDMELVRARKRQAPEKILQGIANLYTMLEKDNFDNFSRDGIFALVCVVFHRRYLGRDRQKYVEFAELADQGFAEKDLRELGKNFDRRVFEKDDVLNFLASEIECLMTKPLNEGEIKDGTDAHPRTEQGLEGSEL